MKSHATAAAKQSVYFDALDRELRRETEGFDGTPVFEDTEYYSASDGAQAGRVKRRSRAYYQGDSPAWESVTYDVQSRVLT